MTDQELFDKCLATFQANGCGIGLRFDPHKHDGAPIFFDQRAKVARARIAAARRAYSELPEVYFNFVDNRRVNAWAWIEKKRHFIGYAAGTEHLILALFHRLLGDRNVLSFLDGADNERPNREVIEALGPDVATLANAKIGVPVDRRRQALALWLRELVCDFIVSHELAHHLQGHCGYRNYHMPLSPLIDPARPSTPEEADLVMQVQEMYADAEAMWVLLGQIETAVGQGSGMPEPLDEYCKNPRVLLSLWMFGINVFCRVWGNDSLKAKLGEGSHPHWRFRQINFLDHVDKFVKQSAEAGRPFGAITNARELVVMMLGHAEYAMALITGQPPESSRFQEWIHPTVNKHQAKLVTIWREGLRKEHERFKFGHLPE